MLAGTMNELSDLSGTNSYEIVAEHEVYECECESDCIEVSGIMIDGSSTVSNTVPLFTGGSDAINGYYCYDSSCTRSSSCYINDHENTCTVSSTLLEETNPDGDNDNYYES